MMESPKYYTCMRCFNTEATGCCLSCARTLCDNCSKSHRMDRHFQNHIYVSCSKDQLKHFGCVLHHTIVEAYCIKCCIRVCSMCLLATHVNHDCLAFSKVTSNFNRIEETISAKVNQVNANLSTVSNIIENTEQKVTYIGAQIVQLYGSQCKTTETMNKVKEHQVKLQSIKTNALDLLSKIEKANLETLSILERIKFKVSALKEPIPGNHNISLENSPKVLDKFYSQLPTVDHVDVKIGDLNFMIETQDRQSGYLSGSLLKTVVKKHGHGIHRAASFLTSARSRRRGSKQEDTGSIQNARLATRRFSLQYIPIEPPPDPEENTQPKLLWLLKTGSVISLGVLPKGDIITLIDDYPNGVIRTYNKSGSQVDPPFDVSVVKKPCSISVNRSSSTVVILDIESHCITIFTVCNNKWISSSLTTYFMPWEICLMTCGDILLSKYHSNDSLVRYDRTGQVLQERTFTHGCYYPCTDNNNRILLSDLRQVYIYSDDMLQLCKVIGGPGTPFLEKPCHLCVTVENHIIITDIGTRQVILFDPESQDLRVILRLRNEGAVYLSVYQDRFIAVGSWEFKDITMFQVSLSIEEKSVS